MKRKNRDTPGRRIAQANSTANFPYLHNLLDTAVNINKNFYLSLSAADFFM